MHAAAWALFAVAAAFAVADWLAVARKIRLLEYACKPATLGALTAMAIALTPDDQARRWWFVAGLALGLLGDVFLMLSERWFEAGLASFLAGHICYIVGLMLHGRGARVDAGVAAIAAAAVVVLLAPVAWRILAAVRRDHGPLAAPVGLYMVVIVIMAVVALASGNALAAAGASAFVVSDSTLAWNRFVRPFTLGPLAVIVTYHLGQALLALSLAR